MGSVLAVTWASQILPSGVRRLVFLSLSCPKRNSVFIPTFVSYTSCLLTLLVLTFLSITFTKLKCPDWERSSVVWSQLTIVYTDCFRWCLPDISQETYMEEDLVTESWELSSLHCRVTVYSKFYRWFAVVRTLMEFKCQPCNGSCGPKLLQNQSSVFSVAV